MTRYSADVLALNPALRPVRVPASRWPVPTPCPVCGTELEEQIALFAFFAQHVGRVPALGRAFHVPNGGKRDKATAGQMRASGVRAGCPDILLPVRTTYAGLALELKVPPNVPSAAQEDWLTFFASQGWYVTVCWGWAHAAREVVGYLGLDAKEFGL